MDLVRSGGWNRPMAGVREGDARMVRIAMSRVLPITANKTSYFGQILGGMSQNEERAVLRESPAFMRISEGFRWCAIQGSNL